jgi:hypothetical protein
MLADAELTEKDALFREEVSSAKIFLEKCLKAYRFATLCKVLSACGGKAGFFAILKFCCIKSGKNFASISFKPKFTIDEL